MESRTKNGFLNNHLLVSGEGGGWELFRALVRRYAIVLIFIVMFIIMSLATPAFLQIENLLNIVRQISVIGLIAMGVTAVIICAGIDLSSGSVIALSAVVAASFAQRAGWAFAKYPGLVGLPVYIPVAAGLLVGVLCGFINGWLIAKTKIPPFIATLGMMIIARGMALLYSNGRPISSLTDSYNFIGQGVIFGIPVPIIILIAMVISSSILLNNTKFGRYIYAIGGNEQAAKVSGLNVSKYKIMVYTFAGLLSGLAGIVLSSRISSGQPGLGQSYELFAIASAVIGGTSLSSGGIGTISGTIIGALIIGVMYNGLDLLNVSAYWQQIVQGLIIIGAIILDERKNKTS